MSQPGKIFLDTFGDVLILKDTIGNVEIERICMENIGHYWILNMAKEVVIPWMFKNAHRCPRIIKDTNGNVTECLGCVYSCGY